MGKYMFSLTEWITKFAFLNILWLFFSAVGLVAFGLFPATVGMFAVIRKWLMGDGDIAVFHYFWKIYKKEFIKANIIGLIIVCLAFIVYVDLYFMKTNTTLTLMLLHIPLYLFMLAFTLTVLYLFPVYVHYEANVIQVFKNAFLIMIIHPLHNIGMVAGITITIFIGSFIPGLIFFFGGSFIAYLIMGTTYNTFERVKKKKNSQADNKKQVADY